MGESAQRPLRADAERSVHAILEAAERVLGEDPAAPMERVAEVAGVARATVHRRFASRQALVEALADNAVRRLSQAIDDGRPDTAPPLVALHGITANVLRVKTTWSFALDRSTAEGSGTARAQEEIALRCLSLLTRARDAGMLDTAADLEWVRRVYYALIGESLRGPDSDTDPDILAERIVRTLLHGFGPRPRASAP